MIVDYCSHEVTLNRRSHPSDYMPPFDSHSSSREEPNSQTLLRYSHTHYSHTHITSTSLLSPSTRQSPPRKKKQQKNNKKPSQSTYSKVSKPSNHKKGKQPVTKTKVPQKQKKDVEEYLVLGDSFYHGENVGQISRRMIEPGAIVMEERRWIKKEKNCVGKIQKYIRGFLQANREKKAAKISPSMKAKLYWLLKEEQEAEERLNFEAQLRNLVEQLEARTEQLIENDPQNTNFLIKWKNTKLHQLMAAQSLLSSQALRSINIFDLPRQLELLQEERFFPEMRKEAELVHKQIALHLQRVQRKQKEDQGVRWVLGRLFSYLTDNAEQWERVAMRLQDYENGIVHEPLLSDRLYINFQKHEIGSSEGDDKIFLHIFNKSVFDLINQNIGKVEMLYPAVQCLKEIFLAAQNSLENDKDKDVEKWPEDAILLVADAVLGDLLDEWLEEFIDFL